MPDQTADVAICGAGIAGISAAYHLTVNHGLKDVLLVDERPPLSLTSDKSTECYRNWWPGPGVAMVGLMNRSIDIMEELACQTDNVFHLNRRGYLYATADPARVEVLKQVAEETARLGAGPARFHTGQPDEPSYVPSPPSGFSDQPTGSDVILDPALIRQHFPYLPEDVLAVVHARRAGWFSAQQLGMTMLEQARQRGARLVQARLEDVQVSGGRVEAVRLNGSDGPLIVSTRQFVNAAGPFVKRVGHMIGIDLPVYSERHLKLTFNDHLGVVPRDAPLIIWADPQRLLWSDEEKAALSESEETRWLLDEFPPGVHARPEGEGDSPMLLILWAYDVESAEPVFPLPLDSLYAEIVLRGLSAVIPEMTSYFDHMPRPVLDGGYYAKTRENRPLIGLLPVEGAYLIGALSGFGLMAGPAAGELLAAHLTGGRLPPYAPAFALERYDDPAYQTLLDNWPESGQL